ncbi:sugar transporter, partial [Pseudomonas sp. MWU12-2534b]
CLYPFELTQPKVELTRLVEGSQRGLDLRLTLVNNRGHGLLRVLPPLTSSEGAQGYLTRLGKLVHEHFGMRVELASLGVKVLHYDLESARQRDGLRNFLYNECGLNDQQVAV